jgi:UDP-N-acetylmuramate dehydrogenase
MDNLKIEKDKDISNFLTLKTRVVAEYFVDAKRREDLIAAKKYSIEENLPLFMLGGGSNLAVTKDRLPGLIVKDDYRELKVLEESSEDVLVSVSSGYPVTLLIAKTVSSGWSGFELHQGLPGTVGGAIYMNSKWTKPPTYFGDDLVYAYLVDNQGEVKRVDRDYFEFAYDYSVLQKTKEIVLEGVFRLKKDDKKKIQERATFALDYRKKTQPYGIASSGCFFRNISNEERTKLNLSTTSAGYLIDQAGLKGRAVGNFYVSPIHANFIVNRGGGKRADLIQLVNTIKETVKKKFGVKLEEEVIVI